MKQLFFSNKNQLVTNKKSLDKLNLTLSLPVGTHHALPAAGCVHGGDGGLFLGYEV